MAKCVSQSICNGVCVLGVNVVVLSWFDIICWPQNVHKNILDQFRVKVFLFRWSQRRIKRQKNCKWGDSGLKIKIEAKNTESKQHKKRERKWVRSKNNANSKTMPQHFSVACAFDSWRTKEMRSTKRKEKENDCVSIERREEATCHWLR